MTEHESGASDGSVGIPAPSGTGHDGVVWGMPGYEAYREAEASLATGRRSGPAASHDDIPTLARAVADTLFGLEFRTWDFGDSIAFESMLAASDGLGEERWVRFAHGWGRAWASRSRPYARRDCTVPGRALTTIAERFGDTTLLAALRELATYLRGRRRLGGVYETWDRSPLLRAYGDAAMSPDDVRLVADPPAGVFVDCLHFDPPFFAALGRVTDDGDLLDDAIAQARGYCRLLQRPDGLFDHFALRGEPGSFGPGWGRGQGWAVLGLLETIDEIERAGLRQAPDAVGLRENAQRLLRRMAALQRPDGHWYAVVTDPDSGDEYSTAAFMARAFREAVRLGIGADGDAALFGAVAARARHAVIHSFDAAANLREVSAAVYSSTVPAHYAAVPRGYVVPWGQGPALLAVLGG